MVIELDVPENANGVLYALGNAAGGLTLYMADGYVCYEYHLFILQRTRIRSEQRLPTGRVSLEIETGYEEARPAGPISVTAMIDSAEVMSGTVPVRAPLAFTANDCLDIGTCLGSPVSLDYYDRAPFPSKAPSTQ